MTYLLDSTIYIDWMRQGRNPIRALSSWLRAGSLVGCGVVRAEVLRGMVSPAARREMELLFEHIPDVPMAASVWDEIAGLAWEMDRSGDVLPLTDIAIAVCARRAKATVVTRDKHFRSISGVQFLTELPGL
ncbi:MAG: type II toxin-antitoxin system VapC family toxin [Kiritimatiellia bacterium]